MKRRIIKLVTIGLAIVSSMAISLTDFADQTASTDPNAEALAQYYAALAKMQYMRRTI